MTIPISFHDVRKSYAAASVLNGIELQVQSGQALGLVGVNGAGKSTLLKALLDLTAIDQGRIEIFGRDHRDTRARGNIAYLAENFQPPHFVRGEDFLRFITRLHQVHITTAAIENECASLELDRSVLGKPAREYSKGMRQKLGLIGCLLSERPLLVMDEPMSGLDPKARALFKARLRRLRAEGRTLLFSTHLLDDLASICDAIAVLHDGRIRFHGPLATFAETYPSGTLETAFLRCIDGDPAT